MNPPVIPPLITDPWAIAATIAGAYLLTMLLGGPIVLHFVRPKKKTATEPEQPAPPERRYDAGAIIGRCENFITITFVLVGEATGLALIFAAKSIVRKDQISLDASYYLGGTLINLVWGLLVGSIARILIFGL